MLPLSPAHPLRTVTGVQLTLFAEGSWVAACCRLQRRGTAVTVQGLASGLSSLSTLRTALPETPTPIALVLAGRGILYRRLPRGGNPASTLAEKVATVLPGATPADFYVQQYRVQSTTGEDYEHLSLVRKEVVDTLLTELRQVGLWVVDLSLGPVRLAALLPYLPHWTGQSVVAVADFQLSINASPAITDFTARPPDEPPPIAVQIGADTIAPEAVLPYAAALSCLLSGASRGMEGLNVPAVKHGRAEWWHFQLFQGLRLGLPCLLLAILLVNFFVSQQLSRTREDLTVDLSQSQAVLTRLKNLQQTAAQKQAFLSATGWEQPSWNSLCADRLAATIPAGVHLVSLEVSPSQTPSGSSASGAGPGSTFRNGVVLVIGQCQDAQRLNVWLQKVSVLRWVRAVREQNFTYDYANGVGTFTFTLEINPPLLFR